MDVVVIKDGWFGDTSRMFCVDTASVLHYVQRGEGLTLEAGMVFTIEPMLNAGQRDTRQLPDGWTVVTKDRSLSAQFEHMVTVTPSGFTVLTPWPGGTATYAPVWNSTGARHAIDWIA